MFKFIHAADIHLDSPLCGLSKYESAPVEAIRDACRNAFKNLVDLAIEEKVSFVLLAGDLYDGDWKDYSTGIFLSQQVGRLGQNNIKVFAVAGNHDAANRITKALNCPANMTILSNQKVETIRLSDLSVVIHGRGFETQHVNENIAAGFPLAEKGMFNIGLLHTSLDGREGHAVYAPCSADDLRSKGYQYWALGHIHKQEYISEDPWIIFPGCIQGRHIRETGAKGCILATVEDGAICNVEKRSLDVFRWVENHVDLTECVTMNDVLDQTRRCIENEINNANDLPVAMRISFEGITTISDEIAAFPEQFEHQIKALGAEIAEGKLWVERVKNITKNKRNLESALTDDGTIGKLLNDILALSNRPDEINGLKDIITNLKLKIPPEALSSDSLLNFSENKIIERLIDEAKDMLVGRLLASDGAK